MKNNLTIQDLNNSFLLAKQRDGKLNKKQLEILSKKALNSHAIPKKFFWEWFVKTNGVPQLSKKGFSMNPEAFAYYYFESLNNQ